MQHLERYRDMIPDFDEFLQILATPLPLTVRVNLLKTTANRLKEHLDRAGIGYSELRWYPYGLRLEMDRPGRMLEHLMGHIYPQEEMSMVPVAVLSPRPGESVLDICAAPGSKTTQISMHMENRGLAVANEPSAARIVPLRANCERMGALNVAVTKFDGRHFPRYQFDRVLVDAPCSSQGMARKDLKVLDRYSVKRSLDLHRLQVEILHRAISLVRPGGVVVYSTCTYAPEENEAVVARVLDRARLEDVALSGLSGSPGLEEWEGTDYGGELKRCARYYPHQNNTGGFFVAKLIKT
ncbi:MAG: RsmB/NOP family class I SAM-dependent RNA methyltransferase [Methanosarcinales archaeon]|nr:RsmB/NOP family class I SAM-dependent RNA methyltransferase [Methanosarcinales archaeon]